MRYLVLLTALAACGSSPAGATPPRQHRAAAATCPDNAGANPPDQCTTDSDCTKEGIPVCSCKGQTRAFGGASPNNVCIQAGCRVDTDCPGAVCSPTVQAGCGAFYGIQGYYCHSAEDACGNDSDCFEEPNGYCAYAPGTGKWGCYYTLCAG